MAPQGGVSAGKYPTTGASFAVVVIDCCLTAIFVPPEQV
jgi:hypothetical protein